MDLDAAQTRLWRQRTPRSRETWERTKTLIPTGHGGGMGYFLPYPIMVDRARGSRLWDVDGNEYLDLRIGDWVNIHGHADPDVDAAIRAQLDRSVQIGGPEWPLGHRFAELLVERVPSAEKVRYFASGTDANLAAVRLARVATGRMSVAKVQGSYHGTSDLLLVGPSVLRDPDDLVPSGVPPETLDQLVQIPYNDADGAAAVIERHAHELAAVLVEPCLTAAGMVEAAARRDGAPRDRAGLRRGRHLPRRLRRRAGGVRGHARPDDAREGHRWRSPGVRPGRTA
jgi:glutamate-1-semialdehyde 2,1-aminomutase